MQSARCILSAATIVVLYLICNSVISDERTYPRPHSITSQGDSRKDFGVGATFTSVQRMSQNPSILRNCTHWMSTGIVAATRTLF